MNDNRHMVIMGPTASGKTGLAIALAQAMDAEIINADAMQIYTALPTLTARPSPQEIAAAPHHLFGILQPHDVCNAQRWTQLARDCMAEIQARGKRVILVGGTGFYLRALMEGLDDIPEISPAVREDVRALSTDQAYEALTREDPDMARRFAINDGQRIKRALEVWRSCGQSLAAFQTGKSTDTSADYRVIKLLPDRDLLYARCDLRLASMWDQAYSEALAYDHLAPDPAWPLSKAIGLPQLQDWIAGRATRDEALTLAQQKTRNYAKRQLTWLRNQHQDATNIPITDYSKQQTERLIEKILIFLSQPS